MDQKPIGYCDPMVAISFASGSTKEWVWAKSDHGLIPVYAGRLPANILYGLSALELVNEQGQHRLVYDHSGRKEVLDIPEHFGTALQVYFDQPSTQTLHIAADDDLKRVSQATVNAAVQVLEGMTGLDEDLMQELHDKLVDINVKNIVASVLKT